MREAADLRATLRRIDGPGYGAYAFEDYRTLQAALPEPGIVAFVADRAVPFRSPPSLRVWQKE
ncbi:hypothetical protein [Methanofollis tationis]|uniref:Uncharacterized protein n=1 Tax=Methanofollis tationis TaxID=81417 RepID=A0A7K4HLT1_9EURY|nr:hypothetical protein [Methanofollis tationis]NVO66214.1 hypothetical protein [Methanofollis tationis]